MIRNWILNLHLYGGIVCSSYLIILGLSSIAFNHHMAPDQSQLPVITWQRTLNMPINGEDMEIATKVCDALGLVGWPLPWEMHREANNDLRFDLSRPGKYYTIHLNQNENMIYVKEKRLGFTSVILQLHGFSGELPGSEYMNLWSVYTEVTTWVVLFSLISGVYLWLKRAKGGKPGTVYLVVGLIGFIIITLYIWIVG